MRNLSAAAVMAALAACGSKPDPHGASDAGPQCVATGCTSPAPDAGLRCEGHQSRCVGDDLYACVNEALAWTESCAALGKGCDSARGCLHRCGAGGSCSAGRSCDEASQLCVTVPACAVQGDCPQHLTCWSGACLAQPPGNAWVYAGPLAPDAGYGPDSGWQPGLAPADLGCYRGDAMPDGGSTAPAPDGGVQGVVFSGRLLDLADHPMTEAAGYTIELFRAEEFARAGAAFATTQVRPRSRMDPSAVFSFDDAPLETNLVALTSGPDGVDTYESLRLPRSRAEEFNGVWIVRDLPLHSVDRAQWAGLVAEAGVDVGPGRSAIMGRVYDCRAAPLPIVGATVALTTPSSPFYSTPNVVFPDAELTATSIGGRFFFFDVPALSGLQVAAAAADVKLQSAPMRTVANSITWIDLSPPGR